MIKLDWPLMHNNITDEDLDVLVQFLSQRPAPIMTNGPKVREFEKLWSEWLGVKYSVFVNSGSSANILTMLLIKETFGDGEVITTPFGWVSDISSITHAGLKPVFCDIKSSTLSMDEEWLERRITEDTRAVLLTHILGYNGLSDKILDLCHKNDILLVEDVCESHGATFKGKKLGSYGDISNFSFYYAHHMTTVEGGMICTNNEMVYNMARALRSHGMVREMESSELKNKLVSSYPDLNEKFVFVSPAYNMRSTEMNAVIGINQLKRLDDNNEKRKRNLAIFLERLNPKKFFTFFETEGNCNYAFTLLLQDANFQFRDAVEDLLTEIGVEFRRGMSGGGNQLRQPYLRNKFPDEFAKYPECDFVHHFGWYIGNYPDLEEQKIKDLCDILNNL